MLPNKPLMVVGTLLICGISAGSLFRSMRHPQRPPFNPLPFRGLGEVAAKQAGQLLGQRGQVVVWTYQTTPQTREIIETSLEGFQHALNDIPGLTLQPVERVKLPAGSGVIADVEVPSLSEDEFAGLLTKYATADAVVSFIAPPALSREEIAALPQPRPKFIVVSLFSSPAVSLVDDGLIQVAILNQPDSRPGDPPPETAEEWADRYYRVVTAENARALSR